MINFALRIYLLHIMDGTALLLLEILCEELWGEHGEYVKN